MKLNLCSLLLCLPFLFACQSNYYPHIKQISAQTTLYLDNQYIALKPLHIETEQEVFQLNNEMLTLVETKLTNNLPAQQKAYILLNHLFNEEKIALTYRDNANLTASQAYQRKVANCMSLTIMAYALAEKAGMNISFQAVKVPEYWVNNGQYSLLTGHVNLLVREDDYHKRIIVWGEKTTTIDFDPFVAKKKFPSTIISKDTVVAMFYNNKGAQALVDDNYPLAYHYFKQATLSDNQFSSAWGNLGILYKLSGHYPMAEKAYNYAISLDPDNLTSLGNLALLLSQQGRANQALLIEEYITKARANNPYYHALLGNEAFLKQSYQQALEHYKKAIDLDDEQHEFYFAIAKIYYQQGQLLLAKKSMLTAVKLVNFQDIKKQYIAKLNFLKGQSSQSD